MKDLQTPLSRLTLVRPDPERDAPFALSWFKSPHGKETLLLMGNPEHAIRTPTIDREIETIREFLKLEKKNQQLTWMIRYDDITIGAVWLELLDTKYVTSPAVHIMIGDKKYRGKGYGKMIMKEMIGYAKHTLKAKTLYSRHLASNTKIAYINEALGFIKDGNAYTDADGLVFQNIKLEL